MQKVLVWAESVPCPVTNFTRGKKIANNVIKIQFLSTGVNNFEDITQELQRGLSRKRTDVAGGGSASALSPPFWHIALSSCFLGEIIEGWLGWIIPKRCPAAYLLA